MKSELPLEFKQCPVCHSNKTVSQLACASEPSIPEGTFTSLEKVFTPIQDVSKLLGAIVRGVLCHFDVCNRCGTRYCTKAEIVSTPVMVQHRSGDVIKTVRPPR